MKISKEDYTKYSEKDYSNIKEIQAFLDENSVEYTTNEDELGNFCLFGNNTDNRRTYQIQYLPSKLFPVKNKKYNIDGVDAGFFYNISHKAENEENSFICWVKDYEWANDRKREVLKSYFLHAAGKTKHRFYARECEVKEVPTKIARAFELEHCFYGKRGASLNLGLYTKKDKHGIPKGTLMMIYTFGKNFFGKDNSVEVLRVGTRKFHQVIGGSSKLMKTFIREYPMLKMGKKYWRVDKIKFYSDYDHNIGGSMDGIGFKFVSYSGGGFMNYWVETGEVKHREPVRHKIIMQEMSKGKVISVPNAGVKTFVMNIERDEQEYLDFEEKIKDETTSVLLNEDW